mmetsp:Transcript_45612/g.130741  ORF Transcript_45612/g.130741 Transcript_45612/m.130741 type:complete len:227 (-) Transcript_45612:1133-1813(-)
MVDPSTLLTHSQAPSVFARSSPAPLHGHLGRRPATTVAFAHLERPSRAVPRRWPTRSPLPTAEADQTSVVRRSAHFAPKPTVAGHVDAILHGLPTSRTRRVRHHGLWARPPQPHRRFHSKAELAAPKRAQRDRPGTCGASAVWTRSSAFLIANSSLRALSVKTGNLTHVLQYDFVLRHTGHPCLGLLSQDQLTICTPQVPLVLLHARGTNCVATQALACLVGSSSA